MEVSEVPAVCAEAATKVKGLYIGWQFLLGKIALGIIVVFACILLIRLVFWALPGVIEWLFEWLLDSVTPDTDQ